MSILVKEDYANPDIPLWARNGSGGGGGGGDSVRFIAGTSTPIGYTITTDTEETITSVAMVAPGKSGTYVVNGSFNVWGANFNNHFGCKIVEAASGVFTNVELDTSDIPLSWVSGSINFSWYYDVTVPDDTPTFDFRVQVPTATIPEPQLILTYTIMFYPDP